MRVLAIDTATSWCSVALWLDGELQERAASAERGHGEQALAMIESLLGEAGCSLRSLDAIAFGRGPGAFTGLRLAASLTQGLAWSSGLPVLPVSNLRAVAQQAVAMAAGEGGAGAVRVLACQDARMGEAYWALFDSHDGLAVAAGPESVQAPAPLMASVEPWLQGDSLASAGSAVVAVGAASAAAARRIAAGSALAAYPELAAALGGRCLVLAHLPPPAAAIARLAAAAGLAAALPPGEAQPIYVRDDVARPPASR
jgi:tRNA threonylcarbamoyladenosine biosynthesis protein TsaB